MTTMTQPQKNTLGSVWLALVVALTLVGIAALVYQFMNGMGVTGLSNIQTWGLYVSGFIFFMGLSAGSMVLAALPVIFNMPRVRPYAKIAAFIGLGALIIGGLFIMFDIGKPMRLWHLVAYSRLGSPLLWDMLLTVAYLIISTVYLMRLIQSERRGSTPPKWIAILALVAGLADGLTSFVFATQMAHEFWFSAIQPMSFEIAAVASAGSLLVILLICLNMFRYMTFDNKDLKPIALGTAALLTLNLMLIASEVITMSFTQSESSMELVNAMLATPEFWVEIVTAVLAVGFYLLSLSRMPSALLVIAAILSLVSLLAKRLLFVTLGFSVPNITYPGVDIGSAVYAPSIAEWLLALGMVGFFALILTVGFRTLPLKPAIHNETN